jgi:YD repeat-containing protein
MNAKGMLGLVRRGGLVLLLVALASAAKAQTTVEYIHTDALGRVVAVTNEAGQVIERFDYEPYGAIIGKPNYGGVDFTGHVQDAATGLTYMQQRYYDPGIGRFLSVDP